MRIELREVVCGYHGKTVVDGFSTDVDAESVWCLLGPNEIGKTTLFKTILRLNLIPSGKVLISDHDIHDFGHVEFAQLVGYTPQSHVPPFSFKALDVMAMGHTAHLSTFAMLGRDDFRIAAECLERLEIAHLTERVYTRLSGDERQLVLIAEAPAQRPRFIMMDKSTSNPNFDNQVRVLRMVKCLVEEGYGVVIATHFPDHIFQCKALVSLTTKERRYLYGTASEVLIPDNLALAYSIRVTVFDIDYEGRQPRCVQSFGDPHPSPWKRRAHDEETAHPAGLRPDSGVGRGLLTDHATVSGCARRLRLGRLGHPDGEGLQR